MGGRGARSSTGGFRNDGKIVFNPNARTYGGIPNSIPTAGLTPSANGSSLRYTSTDATLKKLETDALPLGKEELKVVDDDGFVIAAYKGREHSVAYDPYVTRDRIVTHNHPSGYGGTFSEADISGFLSWNQKEIRASAKEGTYSIKRTNKSDPRGFANAYNRDRGIMESTAKRMLDNAVSKGLSKNARRKAYVDVFHQWFKKNSSKYGYEYTFTRNKGYKL